MSHASDNFYALWRHQYGAVPALHDGGAAPPERLLQGIWQQQRLRRDLLVTLDGRAVRILHPGFASVEGGPDFRGAVVQFGADAPVSGDIEVDLQSSGWHAHGHDRNPAFRSVILQVVWTTPKNDGGGPPVLPVAGALDAPLAELATWLGGEVAPALPESILGHCTAPLRELGEKEQEALLGQAALVRLQGKAAQFAARARDAGWEQSLWEGIFRALGYKHNTWPMQRLAELRPRWAENASDAGALQSRLLGIANLLPPDITRARTAADDFVRRLWDRWWRERDAFIDCQLPRSLWRLHSIRPGNHPQRRLALAAHWMARRNLPAQLERWCLQAVAADRQGPVTLLKVLQPPRDDFWTNHLSLRSGRTTKPQALLGEARVTDLAVNVILPWLRARTAESGEPKLTTDIEACYRAWPASEDNSVLKMARIRLLGGAGLKRFRTAAAQQGLLQIVRDFCDRSNAICDQCRFPELVQAWKVEAGTGTSQAP